MQIPGVAAEDGDVFARGGRQFGGDPPGVFQSVEADESELVLLFVLVQGFAHGSLIAGNVQNVVGNLKGDADPARIADQRFCLLFVRTAESGVR